jgi:hypothetical protein
LTEALAAPFVESARKKQEEENTKREQEFIKRESSLREMQSKLARDQASIDEKVLDKLKAERTGIVEEEKKKARSALSDELARQAQESEELRDLIKKKDLKLGEAQKAEAEFRRKQRDLDDKLRESELLIEKRVAELVLPEREKAQKEADARHYLKVAEKEKTISDLQSQLKDAVRKAEQGSQQLRGEVQELAIEALLRSNFPRDLIEPVPKGEFGGDTLHRILGSAGQPCGTILWESKRTKNWSPSWLSKLREDQRTAKAEIAVIVASTLPSEIQNFGYLEGVWVVSPHMVLPVATALRHTITEVALARTVGEGQQTKMQLIYQYMTGSRFRQRVQAIAEVVSSMRDDLERERKVIMKQWAKRDEQIVQITQASVGMYGDLQGIAGKSIQEIEGLEFPLIAAEHDDPPPV